MIRRPMDLLVDSASPIAFVVVVRKGAVRERMECVGAANPMPLVASPSHSSSLSGTGQALGVKTTWSGRRR